MTQTEFIAYLSKFGVFFGIAIGTIIIATLFNRLFGLWLRKSAILLKNDPTNYKFLRHAITALIYLVGIGWALWTLPSFQAVAGSLLTGAGILAVVAGFASQHALSNIMSGIFIIIFKPFRVNDRLRIRDTMNGVVEDITLRHTVIRDLENKRIIIPNSVMSDEIIVNSDFEDDKICKWINIGISYKCDIDLAKAIMAEEVGKHQLHLDNRTPEKIANGEPLVTVRVIGLGEYAVNLRAWAWAKDVADGWIMECDLYESIKKRFDAEGIEIPYPYRNIVHIGKE
ncbi:MAG: mechanosensitive ion channel family protein [Saprospiraceae bacterium]|nr:mechanosensitive ion channel family protein [Saprospiraceae bacterium]